MQKASIILISVGAVLLLLTLLIGWVVIPRRIKSRIEERIQLKPGTPTFERWADITTPITLSFHIFNTTNPDQVKNGAKPILQEVGPYVFAQKRRKINITVDEQEGTVSYRQPVTYFYLPAKSKPLDDLVTVLNAPLLVLTTLGAAQSVAAQFVLQYSVLSEHEDEDLFVTRTVDQVLFKGWHVPLMETLADVTGQVVLKNNTFGFWYPKNGSDEGLMEVKSGVGNAAEFGKIVSWNGKKILDFWTADTCNMINGTDGSIFGPFIEKDQTIRLFSADLCRSLYVKYMDETELNGIKGYRFGAPKEMLSAENKDNYCFCTQPLTHKHLCMKSGAFQISACRRGAPVVMSTPHFLDGDPIYTNQSVGLKPDFKKHKTFLDLEPTTGLMMRAHKRIQVNFLLEPNTLSEHFYNVPTMVYPVLWIDEGATMAVETQAAVHNLIMKPIKIVNIGKWVLVGLSCVLIVSGLIIHFVRSNRQQYRPAATSPN